MISFLKAQILVVVQAILMTAVLFFIHNTVISNVFAKAFFILPLTEIYLFHLIVTTIIVVAVNYKSSQKTENIFNIFMLFTFLKILLVLVFLLPLFLSELKTRIYDVINFFIPYFIYLAFEIFVITNLLHKQK